MPLTFPAHQAPVLPLKFWRPRWFDGTALVVGSAAPDIQQAAPWLQFRSHHVYGVVFFSLPFTVIYCLVLRRWSADGLFGSLPDFGPLRLRSYRVLGYRRPRLAVTISSALLAAAIHVFIDSFTHINRWGSNLFGLNTIWFELPNGPFSTARIIQYTGHSLGSLVGILMFVWLASSRRLNHWYGEDTVIAARSAPVASRAPLRTALVLAVSLAIAAGWFAVQRSNIFFIAGACLVVGLLVAGAVNRPADGGH